MNRGESSEDTVWGSVVSLCGFTLFKLFDGCSCSISAASHLLTASCFHHHSGHHESSGYDDVEDSSDSVCAFFPN